MTIKIREKDPYKPFDATVVNVFAWYDRHTKSWCIQCLNKDGYQVGEAAWAGNKWDKDYFVEKLKEEHGIK